jgi:iron complex outermembrane recepter protein
MAWQALLCATGFMLAAPAMALADKAHFEIPAQAMPQALKAFAAQAHMQLLYQYKAVEHVNANAVNGDLDKHAALEELLRNSGLEAVYTSESAATIRLISSSAQPTTRGSDAAKEGKNSSSEGFLLAQANQGHASNSLSVDEQQSSETKSAPLQEVIVTAQKRAEKLQDVPIPVTSINADSLTENNQVRIQDYYTSIPGLSLMPSPSGSGGSFLNLSIRGITTGVYTSPTVGIMVDDVPYGASTAVGAGGGMVVADIDPADLARVEVLRGPQGTLYGASSMGGLIKFVTADPSIAGVTGRVEADTSSVYNGAELGYGVRGSANVPLSDTGAVRISGFSREDPGYIDNPVLHIDGLNEQRDSGGRVAALWSPSPEFSLKLSALYQDSKSNGFSDVDVEPGLGDLQQNYLPGVGAIEKSVQAYSATLTAKVGSAELTAVSGYNVNKYSDTYDLTYFFASLTQAQFGVTGTPSPEMNQTEKFTQEVRLSTPIGNRVDWLLGVFYTHEESRYQQDILAANPQTGAIVGDFYNVSFSPTYREYAGFTDLTFHATDRFDVQVGARESQIKQTYSELDTGVFLPAVLGEPSPHVVPETQANANAFTYLVTPRFKMSSDLMVYARLASGYRPGGPNLTLAPGTPAQYNPDKTNNYEIGAKGDFLNHVLSVDASLYYIDWKNIQLSLINPQNGLGYTGNGSEAYSQGLELSVESRPLTGLTIAAWMAWGDAALKQALPPTSTAYGVSGDRLPYSNRLSANVSLRQEFPLASRVTGFVGGSLSYVGDREGEFTSTAIRQDLPGFARADLQAGAKYGSWTGNFYVNNLTDRRGLLAGGLGSYPPFAFVYIQPRTVGLSVSRTFD